MPITPTDGFAPAGTPCAPAVTDLPTLLRAAADLLEMQADIIDGLDAENRKLFERIAACAAGKTPKKFNA